MDKKLHQRVLDIYAGALGHQYKQDDDYLGAEELSRVIPALQSVFDPDNKWEHQFSRWNIKHFDNPVAATEHIEDVLRWKRSEEDFEKEKAAASVVISIT